MNKIIVILLSFLLINAAPYGMQTEKKIVNTKNNVTVIVNYDKNNNNRVMLENTKELKKNLSTREKFHYFGIGFAVGGFVVSVGGMVGLFFLVRSK